MANPDAECRLAGDFHSLYFVVFGSAIGSRMGDIDGISHGAFIIPGLVMLSLLMQSISNASFGIYMPKFSGTIYEVLGTGFYFEVVLGYVGAAATKSVILGLIILATAKLFVDYTVLHPCGCFVSGADRQTFSLVSSSVSGQTASRNCRLCLDDRLRYSSVAPFTPSTCSRRCGRPSPCSTPWCI